jgi:uroporphyrinogen decarboxylase
MSWEDVMSMLDQVKIRPAPDFDRFLKVLRREGEPDRVPVYEFFADKPIKDKITGKPCLISSLLLPIGGKIEDILENEIEFWHKLGYDYVPLSPPFSVSFSAKAAADTADLSLGARLWLTEESTNLITNREEFDAFQWPFIDMVDFTSFDMVEKLLPEGMKAIGQSGGILENVMWNMSHTGLAYALADDPELVQMMFDKVGEICVALIERMAEREFVGAIQFGDDMGFKTSTMISPAHLRKYAFPWHKKVVEAAHKHGKPFILHSCGNLEPIMDDLIDDVGIDAKHSFEDIIMPVAEVKEKWGDRVAVMGGVDMDFIARAKPDEVREYTRKVLDACAPGGGYALGCGNTVANYIPPENFLAMLDEGWKWNQERS